MLINTHKPTALTTKKTALVVLMTSFTVLAGCGGGEDSGSSSTPITPEQPPVVNPPVNPEPPVQPPVNPEPPTVPPVNPEPPPVQPPVNPEPPMSGEDITLETIGPVSAAAGDKREIQVNARQSDGVPLRYQIQPELSWVTIDSTTGLITITPNNSALDQQTLTVRVTDGVNSKEETFTVNVQRGTTRATLRFDIRNKEPDQWLYYDMYVNGEKVTVSTQPNPQVPGSVYVSVNDNLQKPDDVFNNLYIGDLITFELRDMRMNQSCRTGGQDKKFTFTLQSTTPPIDIDCQTNAVLTLNSHAGSFYLDEGAIDTFPFRLINADTDKIIANITDRPTMEYHSGDSAVVTLDSQSNSEKITPVGLGTTRIVAEASPEFYRGDTRQEYQISILDKDARKRLEFCQINCADVYSKYQGLVGGRETLVRMYRLEGTHNFTVRSKDGTQLYATSVTCANPTNNNDPVYEQGKTCNVTVPSEFIMPNNQFIVTSRTDSSEVFNVLPNIFPPQYLTVTLVPVRVTGDNNYDYQSTYNYDPDNKTDEEVLQELETLLNDKLPFTKVTLKVREGTYVYNIGASSIDNIATWNTMLTAFRAMQNNDLGGVVHASQNVYYGLVPMLSATVGVASPGVGIGIDGFHGKNAPSTQTDGCSTGRCMRLYQNIMVHEIGHTLGLLHAPCRVPTADISNDWQYAYWKEGPISTGRTGGALSNSPIWVSSKKSIESPVLSGSANTRDIMGYCNGFQFSELNTFAMLTNAYNWGKFGQPVASASAKKVSQKAASDAESEKTITWVINNDGLVFNPLALSGIPATNSSDYSVLLTTDKGDRRLPVGATYVFDSSTTYYSVVLPRDETVRSFTLYGQNDELIAALDNLDQPLLGTRSSSSDHPMFFEAKDAEGNITHSRSALSLTLRKQDDVTVKDYFNVHRYQ